MRLPPLSSTDRLRLVAYVEECILGPVNPCRPRVADLRRLGVDVSRAGIDAVIAAVLRARARQVGVRL